MSPNRAADPVDSGATCCEHANSFVRECHDGCCRHRCTEHAAAVGIQHASEVIVSRAIHNLPDDDRDQNNAVKSAEDFLPRVPQATNRLSLRRWLERRARERVIVLLSRRLS